MFCQRFLQRKLNKMFSQSIVTLIGHTLIMNQCVTIHYFPCRALLKERVNEDTEDITKLLVSVKKVVRDVESVDDPGSIIETMKTLGFEIKVDYPPKKTNTEGNMFEMIIASLVMAVLALIFGALFMAWKCVKMNATISR
jgi:hypothetical protein